MVLSLLGCRASFQNIQKQNLQATGENRPASGNDLKPSSNLENKRELDIDQSRPLGCNGNMIIREQGEDKNRDGVLQPTEVLEVRTECKTITGPDQPIETSEDFGNNGGARENNGSSVDDQEDLGTSGGTPCPEPGQIRYNGRCIPIPPQSVPTQNTPLQSGD
jgi:hypothetical protein